MYALQETTAIQTTIAAIRALSGTLISDYFQTTDTSQQGDWYYDSTDTTSTDNTGTILVTSDGKRIKRIIDCVIQAEWFGAVGDGSTDNTSAIADAVACASSINKPLCFCDGIFLTDPIDCADQIIFNLSDLATIKLNDNADMVGSSLFVIRLNASNSSITGGSLDANRDGQDQSYFNTHCGSVNLFYYGVSVLGTSGNILEGINIQTNIINSVDKGLFISYCDDSTFNCLIDSCGGGINVSNSNNIIFSNNVLTNIDNDNWDIFPHAFDISICTYIWVNGLQINQSGYNTTGSMPEVTQSDWFSGLTVTNTDHLSLINASICAKQDSDMTKSVGVSLLGVTNSIIDALSVIRYTDANLEIGGCENLLVSNFLLDSQYLHSSLFPSVLSYGIGLYNNPLYIYNNYSTRGTNQSSNCAFVNGKAIRQLGYGGYFLNFSYNSFSNVSFNGNRSGIFISYEDVDPGFAGVPIKDNLGNRFSDCDFSFNEYNGIDFRAGVSNLFFNCSTKNNGQAQTNNNTFRNTYYGSLSGNTAGFAGNTVSGSNRSDLNIINIQAYDDQVITNGHGSAYANPRIVTVSNPSQFYLGQTVTLSGCGASGADLICQVLDMNRDEITIDRDIITFPVVLGTGTISTTTTGIPQVTGTGTSFISELDGGYWINVGSEYQQITSATSDTSATLANYFSTALVDQPFYIVKFSTEQMASQDYSIVLSDSSYENTIIQYPNFGTGTVPDSLIDYGTNTTLITDASYLKNLSTTSVDDYQINGTLGLNADSGPTGLNIGPLTANTAQSSRLFFSYATGAYCIYGESGGLYLRTGATAGSSSGTIALSVTSTGVSIAQTLTMSGTVNLVTGSTTVAPLKFTAGSVLTTLVNGTVEFDGTHLYISIASTRYQLDQQTTAGYAQKTAYAIKAIAYTITVNDHIIEVTASGATQTLPTAVGITGQSFIIINSSTGAVLVQSSGSQTIGNDGSGDPTSISLSAGSTLKVVSNGSNYRVL